jgi:uncharacterized linocin/CFP29 family protein
MNGSLGRDRVWNDHIWSEIDKAVREEVGRVRVAQKVFPSTVVNNVLPVSANRVVPFTTGQQTRPVLVPPAEIDDEFKPFFEISKQFVLTQAQVDGEENLHLAPSLARLAASAIANAEDTILFLGNNALGPPASPPAAPATVKGVNVTNTGALPHGFVAEANQFPAVPSTASPPTASDILTAVAEGIAALDSDAQPGPYALFVSPKDYAQAFTPTTGFLKTRGDQIKEVITGGFYMVNSLAASILALSSSPPQTDIGILVSLGGEPSKIILGTEAMTAFTHIDDKSLYHFRVFERIQLVVRDGRAFQTLAL